MKKKYKLFAIILSAALIGGLCASCAKKSEPARRGLNDAEFTVSSLSAVDRNGGSVTPMRSKKTDGERYVGLFYWLWMSNNHYYYHGTYDVTKLMSTPEGERAFWNIDASKTDLQQRSPNGAFHWTNEPLYGYYNSSDPWTITRHMELFIAAGIDFIYLDTSNNYEYEFNTEDPGMFDGTLKSPTYTLLDTMLSLYNMGWDVPKVVFLTNSRSGERVKNVYNYFYKSAKYEPLWFRPDGNPMIVGTTDSNNGASDKWDTKDFIPVTEDMKEYFDVYETQWPSRKDFPNTFPWMSWFYPQTYHTESKIINVSVAQHGASSSFFTGMDQESHRGYDYINNTVEEDWYKGRNFENQWSTVHSTEKAGNSVRFVTVTGWNEWIGMKFGDLSDKAEMVDQFYGPYTRDIEMDKTLYQDDTFLQLVRNIRAYKFEQITAEYSWKSMKVTSFADFDRADAVYKDLAGDAVSRDFWSFDVRRGQPRYTDFSDRNDIVETRVLHDDSNLYFYIETKEAITPYTSGENWMNVLIKTGAGDTANTFGGYNYIINRSPVGGRASVERSRGGWNWESVGSADMTVQGNQMMITVPRAMLGLKSSLRFEFKVSDNVCKPSWFKAEDAEHDIMHYYITGDSAPIGRLNYTYGY